MEQGDKGKILMYINIKYKDGTILPIWFYPIKNELKEMKDWERDCLIVPYLKDIENIVVSFGIFDFKKPFSIFMDSLSISYLQGSDPKNYMNQCNRKRELERTTQQFYLQPNYFKSEIEPVTQ
jgi:hypothetical protein